MALTRITTQQATSISTFTLPNIFSATYDTYKVVISKLQTTNATTDFQIRMVLSGAVVDTNSIYSTLQFRLLSSASTQENSYPATTHLKPIQVDDGTSHNPALVMHFFNPLDTSVWTTGTYEGASFNTNPSATNLNGYYGGFHYTNTASVYGLEFSIGAGTMDIELSIYGYKES